MRSIADYAIFLYFPTTILGYRIMMPTNKYYYGGSEANEIDRSVQICIGTNSMLRTLSNPSSLSNLAIKNQFFNLPTDFLNKTYYSFAMNNRCFSL